MVFVSESFPTVCLKYSLCRGRRNNVNTSGKKFNSEGT